MNTLQIDQRLKTENGFLGAHPYNVLPKSRRRNISLVINTASSQEAGEHWVALVRRNNIFYFLDSYGRNFNNFTFSKEFRVSIRKYIGSYKCKFNGAMLQQLTSNTCGFYAIFFIKKLNRKYSLWEIQSYFTGNTHLNDENIVGFVDELI